MFDVCLITFIGVSYLNFVICQDWARNHSDDKEIESAKLRGEDPGLALVCCPNDSSIHRT